MKADMILDELWKVKVALAAEAGYDTGRFLENLRRWEAEHRHPGGEIRSDEELRQLVSKAERQQAEAGALVLKVAPPDPGRGA